MTIAVGFQCADGIVIGADTEISGGAFKLQGDKVRAIRHCDSVRLAMTGAGDMDYLEYAFQRISRSVREGMTQDDVEAVVVATVEDLYRNHIYQNPAYQGPTDTTNTDLIVGVWTKPDEWHLLRSSLTAVVRVPAFHIAGSGLELGRFIADRFFPTKHQINVPLGVAAATAVLMNGKEYVQGCGGRTHLLALVEDGRFAFINTAGIENDIREIDSYCWSLIRVALTAAPDNVRHLVNALLKQAEAICESGSIREQIKRIVDNA